MAIDCRQSVDLSQHPLLPMMGNNGSVAQLMGVVACCVRVAGGSTRVPNNADYGTFEAPLNQENDDPVSDFLYTSNFALLGLHEAAAALGDPKIKAVEDKLADFIVRIQARSTEHPDLDGAFFRAFDCTS